MADVVDVGAAVPPLALDVCEDIPALLNDTAVVLDLKLAVFADVAEVRCIAFMPRPPPVTLTMTWGARRTVDSIRLRIASALLEKGPSRGVRLLTIRLPG